MCMSLVHLTWVLSTLAHADRAPVVTGSWPCFLPENTTDCTRRCQLHCCTGNVLRD